VIYRDAPTFRSEAGVVVGEPITWQDLSSCDPEDRTAAQDLTERIREGLATVTRHLTDWADQAVVEHAAAVLAAQSPAVQAPPSWVARASGILARMNADQDPGLPTLRRRVRAHARALARLQVTPAELARDHLPPVPRWWRGWRAPLVALVWIVGVVWTWPPYRATGALAHRFAPDTDTVATFKAAIGLLLFTLWIALSAMVIGRLCGWPWGVLALPAGVGLAFLTLWLEESRLAAESVTRARKWRARRAEKIQDLREEQQALAGELGRVVERLAPER
jgi:hypothetical protein